jgi:N-acetylmuramoyl-L-alanine amidase
VDAGHGGEDPGARGAKGTKEKDVTLAIARKLANKINQEPGMKAVLVRNGDYYIGLRKRMAIARKHRADLFVSIHADSFRDKRVRGSSVYTLSRRGASSEAAKWLAEKENSADLVGGVSLDDKDDVLAGVLLDLSQTATLQASGEVAHHVYKQLGQVGKVHGKRVQRAGFAVLKSPDIPSMLIETAFISNPAEERNLTSPSHQTKIARAIMRGIKGHFHDSPPAGTKLALMLRRKRNGDSEEPVRTSGRQTDLGSRMPDKEKVAYYYDG